MIIAVPEGRIFVSTRGSFSPRMLVVRTSLTWMDFARQRIRIERRFEQEAAMATGIEMPGRAQHRKGAERTLRHNESADRCHN